MSYMRKNRSSGPIPSALANEYDVISTWKGIRLQNGPNGPTKPKILEAWRIISLTLEHDCNTLWIASIVNCMALAIAI